MNWKKKEKNISEKKNHFTFRIFIISISTSQNMIWSKLQIILYREQSFSVTMNSWDWKIRVCVKLVFVFSLIILVSNIIERIENAEQTNNNLNDWNEKSKNYLKNV